VQHTISKGTVTAGDEPILLQNQSTAPVPNFAFSEPTPFPEVEVGSTGASGSLTISAENGFTGTVTLSCPTTFGASSCSITPTSVKAFPATATLVINGTSFSAGAYQLAVQGVSGSITNTFNVAFNIGDYSLTGPATLSAMPSAQATANLTVTSLDSYSGQVNATCDATSLAGAQCTLSPANPITVASGGTVPLTASVTIPSTAVAGTYNITISLADVSGAPVHAFTTVLTVTTTAPVNDFAVSSITPATQTITPGQSAQYNFTVSPVGASFTSAVSLSCSGAPATTTCTFSPTSATPGTAPAPVVMTITTIASSANASPNPSGRSIFLATWLMLPGIVLFGFRRRASRRGKSSLPASLLSLFLLGLLLTSCGGGGSTNSGGGTTTPPQQTGTPAGTYTITVTGTSGPLTHQAPGVTLVVNQ
jgi:hypothetical protein